MAIAVVLGVLHLLGPFLARHYPRLAQPRPPDQLVTASSALFASPAGPFVAAPGTPITSFRTLLDFQYHTPIDVNDTADIQVGLRQEKIVELLSSFPSQKPAASRLSTEDETKPGTYDVTQLKWAVVLRLEGLGFDWTQNDIPIKLNTPLPDTEHWVPRAKNAGEYKLRFPLRDINHAAEVRGYKVSDVVKVAINGISSEVRGSDDITLPVSVWTHGMPAFWWDQLTFWGSAGAAAFGLASPFLLEWFKRKLGRKSGRNP